MEEEEAWDSPVPLEPLDALPFELTQELLHRFCTELEVDAPASSPLDGSGTVTPLQEP